MPTSQPSHFLLLFCVMEASARSLLSACPAAIDNSRGDEDQEFRTIVVFLAISEEPTQDRDVREEGDSLIAETGVARVDTADDRRVAVADQHGGLGFLLLDRGITAGADVCLLYTSPSPRD